MLYFKAKNVAHALQISFIKQSVAVGSWTRCDKEFWVLPETGWMSGLRCSILLCCQCGSLIETWDFILSNLHAVSLLQLCWSLSCLNPCEQQPHTHCVNIMETWTVTHSLHSECNWTCNLTVTLPCCGHGIRLSLDPAVGPAFTHEYVTSVKRNRLIIILFTLSWLGSCPLFAGLDTSCLSCAADLRRFDFSTWNT